jgi:crotonobetainyl-CoA:carnitine CoA-transferase CaiB-like acyl-CoA transferase
MPSPPLASLRVIESSMLGPAAITTHLADLGADVIKVESPAGDYVRQMTWPIVEGVSLMHLHVNRGKRSLVLDLRTQEGVDIYLDLVRGADVVIEAMRPGGLAKRGLGFDRLCEVNPRIVFCTISGYGMTGPYKDMPSHGVAYDVWAGLVKPEVDDDGFTYLPEHPSTGIHAGPLFGALGVLAAVIRARATGEPARLDIAQSDATTNAARRGRRACATGFATSSTRRRTGTSCSRRPSVSSGRTSATGSNGRTCSRSIRARSMRTMPSATSSCEPSCATSSPNAPAPSGSNSASGSTRRS